MRLRIKLEGVSYDVEVEALPEPERALDEAFENDFLGEVACPPPPSDALPQDSICRSPINGAVVSVLVKPGDQVRKDDTVAVVEAIEDADLDRRPTGRDGRGNHDRRRRRRSARPDDLHPGLRSEEPGDPSGLRR